MRCVWLVSEADEREEAVDVLHQTFRGQSLGDDKFLPFVIDQFHPQWPGCVEKSASRSRKRPRSRAFSQANRFIQSLKELGCKFRAR